MNASTPRYILYSDAVDGPESGRWRFLLHAADSTEQVEADELEPGVYGERLELLAVVRGLEALDQPSLVSLVTSSAYVREGIRHGLAEWRRRGWCWEFFGQMVPVKNRDLWRRVDRALKFHQVECRGRNWRFDPPHLSEQPPEEFQEDCIFQTHSDPPIALEAAPPSIRAAARRRSGGAWWRRWTRQIRSGLSALVPSPHFG